MGVRRHVTDPDSLAAWKFDLFWQMLPLSDEAIAALPEADALPAAPELAKSDDGSPEVWLIDGEYRRHVPSPQAMAEWQLSFGDIVTKPAAEITALKLGPPLRDYPILVKDSTGRVELVDEPHPAEPPIGSGGSGSTGSGGSSGWSSGAAGAGSATTAGSGQKTKVIGSDEQDGSCACQEVRSPPGVPGWLALFLLLPLVRRRRLEVAA
jgi:uncharacterized protein (TIGR03382 family)